ncbi:hypothetical protein YN1_7550 [Nanoarchaeota archaeon]
MDIKEEIIFTYLLWEKIGNKIKEGMNLKK